MYWGSSGELATIDMAFLNGSGHTTLYRVSSAQFTGITLLNNSLYISDRLLRLAEFSIKLQTNYLSQNARRVKKIFSCNCYW